MKRLIIALAVVVAVQALAGCGGGGYNSSSPPATQSGDGTATVSVEKLGDSGRVLVNSAGMALYAADEEADSRVVCTGACASFWIPLTIHGGSPSGLCIDRQHERLARAVLRREQADAGDYLHRLGQDQLRQIVAGARLWRAHPANRR